MSELREDIIEYLLEYYPKKDLEDISTEILYMIKKTIERNIIL